MKATVDFTAHIDGVDYALKKGDEFKGPARAVAALESFGVLSEGRKAKKEVSDGSQS